MIYHLNAKRNQSGAVWVEFLVASSTVLISLFFLIPILAKNVNIKHSSEKAAQYTSWERTVWHGEVGPHEGFKIEKKTKKLLNEARSRVLGDANSLIYDGVGFTDNSFHHFKDNHSGQEGYKSLLGSRSQSSTQDFMSLQESNKTQPGGGDIKNALDNNFLYGGRSVEQITDDLSKVAKINGYYQSDLSVNIKRPDWISAFKDESTTLMTKKAILVDGWGSGGTNHNKSQVNKLQPKTFSQIAKPVLDTYKNIYVGIGSLFNMSDDLKRLEFDHVDTDELLIPSNQLGTY